MQRALQKTITFCRNCEVKTKICKNTMVHRPESVKIHIDITGCHGMDKKSNFELNLQKWVCLRN
jgi:hypothetical protein